MWQRMFFLRTMNNNISIAKAIGAIAMVIAHAECPGMLSSFIFEWHMPLFFIAAGYFFSTKYLNDWGTFVAKRFKGLYVPFVTWAVIFLLLHNVFFEIGLLSEHYGNAGGGVLHPDDWHSFCQNLWHIVFYMGGYDQFICGAYWFFRALLVASILYLLLYKLCRYITKGRIPHTRMPYLVVLLPLMLALWHCCEGLTIETVAQGGYRDLMGAFFYGIGVVFRLHSEAYDNHVAHRTLPNIIVALLTAAVVYFFASEYSSCMTYRADADKCLLLIPPAISGWLMVYNVSVLIDRYDTILRRALIYCGSHTLYILLFHVISYKLVSIVKILCYDLEWEQLGCHMVIHDYSKDDNFWILYSIVGVVVPLLLYRLKTTIQATSRQKK